MITFSTFFLLSLLSLISGASWPLLYFLKCTPPAGVGQFEPAGSIVRPTASTVHGIPCRFADSHRGKNRQREESGGDGDDGGTGATAGDEPDDQGDDERAEVDKA